MANMLEESELLPNEIYSFLSTYALSSRHCGAIMRKNGVVSHGNVNLF